MLLECKVLEMHKKVNEKNLQTPCRALTTMEMQKCDGSVPYSHHSNDPLYAYLHAHNSVAGVY